jgi:lipid A ethanolaminephosphotransferase
MSAVLPSVAGRRFPAQSPRIIGVEALALVASLFFTLVSNGAAWHLALRGRSWGDLPTWRFAIGIGVALTAFQFILLALILTRRTARVVLSVLVVATAVANHFMVAYGVFLDTGMLRNVLRTDVREARELLTASLLSTLALQALAPLVLLWCAPFDLADRSWKRAAAWRAGSMAIAAAAMLVALFAVFQDAAALARNHREVRHLVAPSNYLYAVARVVAGDARTVARAQAPLGTDAVLGPSWAQRPKPALLVLVVGETARAANWGLNGYARQTTPELAQIDGLLNFPDVQSCGTNTETSLPCMFSPWGRHDYDETRIRGHESLMHVLSHAGFAVLWRDNQSGCKGVCAGLRSERLEGLDEHLLDGLDRIVEDTHGNRVLVLHQLGSHGPAYASRYTAPFARFQPACHSAELRECTPAEIVNAYDNSLLYTDHVVASAIRFVQAQQGAYDTALLYVSDHGESLGEHNVYLHGLPRAIAPREQTQVPMVAWLSPGFARSAALDMDCLRARAQQPTSHDHLFHTVLGLLDVRTRVYDGAFDASAGCRSTLETPPATAH